jgi:SulP family sulfate permease
MMAGVMLLVMGLSGMGALIKFIPRPVVLGFTAGIGVVILVGQWKDFFGLPAPSGRYFHQKLPELVSSLPNLHPATTAIGLASLIVLLILSHLEVGKKVPGPLVVLVMATAVQAVFHLPGVQTIGSVFGGIPQGLPHFAPPSISFQHVVDMVGPAFAITLLGAIESLLSAVVADGMAGTHHDPNQELIGQGLANLVAPFFGGFAATGAIARTATNIRNGGNSPMAGVVHSLVLVLVILFLAPLAQNVPLAALSAILFVVAWNMSDLPHFFRMFKTAPRVDIGILLVTFTLTVLVDLLVAVQIGVLLSTLDFLRRMSASVEVEKQGPVALKEELAQMGLPDLPATIQVFAIQGPFFFAAVEQFEHALVHTHTEPETVIIRLRWVPFIDSTGLSTLEHVIADFQRRHVTVKLSGASPHLAARLDKAGIVKLVGREQFFPTFGEAVASCHL